MLIWQGKQAIRVIQHFLPIIYCSSQSSQMELARVLHANQN
jgi:hypothetical protein